MKLQVDSYYEIDYNTNYLIQLFNSGKFLSTDSNELSWKIKQLTEYQYLYLLNEIISNITLTDEVLDLFFTFVLAEEKYLKDNISPDTLTGVYFRFQKFSIKQAIFINPETGILELLRLDTLIKKKTMPLVKSIREKLLEQEKKEGQLFNCFFEDFIAENEYGHPMGDNMECEMFVERPISKLGLVRNQFYIDFDLIHYSVVNTDLNKILSKLCNEAKTLYYNYEEREPEYLIQTIFPIIWSLDDWKKLVAHKLKLSNNEEHFEKSKLFFKQCLKKFHEISENSTILHNYSLENATYPKTYSKNSFSEISKMIDWIDESFTSYGNINLKNEYNFIDEIPFEKKLSLSSKTNQRTILDIFTKYFDTHKLDYDLDALHSLVFHYTTIEETTDSRGYKSKFLDYKSIKHVNFIPKEHTRNILKVFLKLYDSGLIKTGINRTFEIIEEMFKQNDCKGLSKHSAKDVWKKKDLNKKGDSRNLRIDNDEFWFYFIGKLPT